VPPSTQGRWSVIRTSPNATATQRANAMAHQLLTRYGVLTREAPGAENVIGGFSAVYPILKAMEEAGRLRRGYFVAGLGATQFAMPGAVDLLRSMRDENDAPETLLLASTDPANPYGAILKWPGDGLSRSAGASVVLVDGALACWIGRGEKQISTFLPEDEPTRSRVARAVATALASFVASGARRALLLTEVNGEAVAKSAIAPFLVEAGFVPTSFGYQMRAR
jgi:ATP-dependent Lhr-like helicase